MFGFVNVYKPQGWTSFDVVAKLRGILKIKQIGHTGTLDPFATGVLPVCIGKATKLIEYLPGDKEYVATIQFGANTDTYDLDGEITQKFNKNTSENEIIKVLKSFEGEIEQIPPIYSAIKVNGKKLYEYAREGKDVEIKPRKVNIYNIELIEFDTEKQIAKIKVACSKGTYIRSIAYDLGKILNCGGYLIGLERVKAANFTVDNSIKLEDITSENICKILVNPIDVVLQTKYELNDKEKDDVCHGRFIKKRNESLTDVVFFVYGGKMLGVGECENSKIKVKKVFEV